MEKLEIYIGIPIMLWAFLMLMLMGWHGFTFEIGKKGKGFHLWHETYSLKRFFNKKKIR